MVARDILWGIVASALLVLLPLLYFVQTKDLTLLDAALDLVVVLWVILLVVRVMRHGLPVRIVADERRPPP